MAGGRGRGRNKKKIDDRITYRHAPLPRIPASRYCALGQLVLWQHSLTD